jgi:hypothetical protein
LHDGSAAASANLPSWGIFEWNLWTQHQTWAYTQVLDQVSEYGCHVICPNEWDNDTQNTGLWIPGYNSQILAALQAFTAVAQYYPRGACLGASANTAEDWYYSHYYDTFSTFTQQGGLAIIEGCWSVVLAVMLVSIGMIVHARWRAKHNA